MQLFELTLYWSNAWTCVCSSNAHWSGQELPAVNKFDSGLKLVLQRQIGWENIPQLLYWTIPQTANSPLQMGRSWISLFIIFDFNWI